MKHAPFWVDDYPRIDSYHEEQLPAETDFLIVGSGLTGLSAALRLAAAGKSVIVIDEGEVAGGASSINGGMVSPDVKAGVRKIFGRLGPDVARAMWDASVRSVDIVHDLARSHGIEALIHRGGIAALGLRAEDGARFEDTARWYSENLGAQWEVLTGGQVSRVVGSDAFRAALYEPEGFGIHPARFSFGLANAAWRKGAAVVGSCRAERLERTSRGHRVETTRGTVHAGEVIIATNGYTGRTPSPELRRRVVPVGSYIIVTEPLGRERAERIFPGGAMAYTKRRLLHYMRRTHDDRFLIGGRRNLRADLDLDRSAADLGNAMARYFPDLAGVEITHVWGGRLGVPFDLTPHIGQIDDAWYALGYAGHGVGLATLLGHDLAGMLLGEDPPSVFASIPHPTRWYYHNHPWFLSPASTLYRTLDRFGR